jgi:hypothetical protein
MRHIVTIETTKDVNFCQVCFFPCNERKCICSCGRMYHPLCIANTENNISVYKCPQQSVRVYTPRENEKHILEFAINDNYNYNLCRICQLSCDEFILRCSCKHVYHPECVGRVRCGDIYYRCPFKKTFLQKLFKK